MIPEARKALTNHIRRRKALEMKRGNSLLRDGDITFDECPRCFVLLMAVDFAQEVPW